jgi:protein-glutamine gamma-glutamyltransferase
MRRLFRIPSYRPPDELPTRAASNWLLVSVLLAAAPHAARLPLWLSLTVLVGLAWRFGIDNLAWRMPPRWLRWVLLSLVVLAMLKTFGTFLGREAGIAFLTAAVGLKVLEIRTLRDYLITVFLAYFLLIGGFLYSQSIAMAAYGLAVAVLTTASLALLNNAGGAPGLQVWKLIGRVVLYGLPICLVLYLFFPRIQGSLWALPEDAFSSQTGMTDEVRPGSLSALSANTDPAFRVEFDGEPPDPGDRYWRVYVLGDHVDEGWGRRMMYVFDGPEPGGFEGTGPPIDYTVTLEPHNQRWVPALDLPLEAPEGAEPHNGFLVQARERVNRVRRFAMRSQRVERTGPLNRFELRAHLDMGREPPERVRDLIAPWQDLTDAEKVDAALRYFREEPFRYTLSPPPLSSGQIEEFLFDTRAGYCEHYASAFVSLMRWAGVPARLIAGYQGGEWNDTGEYLTVQQADAHAWAEVWLPDKGWTRADPTAAIAPERIELGAEAIRRLVEEGMEPGQLSREEIDRLLFSRSWVQRQLMRAQFAWENLNYTWDGWVLGYGPEFQRDLMRRLGFERPSWSNMIASLAAGVGLALVIAAVAVTRRRTRVDPVVRAYRRALRKMARAGHGKAPHEGPRAFQQRLEREAPELARRLKPVTEMYVALRYAEDSRYSAGTLRTLVARV